ncbi:MAG: heat-inducible transcriptional repressor HrcA [Arenicella sp.]
MPQDNRSDIILKNLVQLYIKDAHPVGSTKLASSSELSMSSATIRNIMADLENKGLIHSPHTSAGRVPTAKGYRLFVDSFVRSQPLNKQALAGISHEFADESDPDKLLKKASRVLSSMTKFAGVVMLPNQTNSRFKQIEFMPLSGNRILSILVTADGRVQNRVISLTKEYSASELVEAANYFNERYAGSSLSDVRLKLVSDIQSDSDEMHRITQTAMAIASKTLIDEGEVDGGDVMLSGEQKLLDVPDLCQIETLQKLFDVFKTKQDLLDLLDKSMRENGINIFIGEESGYVSLDDCSIVTKSYEVEGEVIGTLGVIGPTRMAYSNVVSVVDVTANLLGKALSGDVK